MPHDIVIIGGGFCGTALAVHLLRSGDPALRVTLVEPAKLGRGVAYGTTREEHVLNVPAGSMSLDPADPQDFVAFARARVRDATALSLLPRRLYGDYVLDRLASAMATSQATLRPARTTAERVRRQGERFVVELADGRRLQADDVVLATGHGPTKLPAELDAQDPRIVRDPWRSMDDLAGRRVLLVGTGLTAVDVVLTLRARGHRGPVHAVSRHGRWPLPHLPTVRWTGQPVKNRAETAPRTADGLAEWLRNHIREARSEGLPWQAVLESVRHVTAKLWERLPDDERARLLQHHRADWEIARHRVPAASWEVLQGAADEGWLVTHAGGLGGMDLAGFECIVLCTGNESDPRKFEGELWRGLLQDRLVQADRHGLGVVTDDHGATLGPDGTPTGLSALGGLLRPRWFESTAVPDLSKQAASLARALVRGTAVAG
jgi:uncharacterized NAD(P)/FAD-binding protein YdhS